MKHTYPKFYHVGVMKTGTTTIQSVLSADARINVINQSRFFNTNRWYRDVHQGCNDSRVCIESNENFVRDYGTFSGFLSTIKRIHNVRPDAVILLSIREQRDFLISGYKHYIRMYRRGESLLEFLDTPMGLNYLRQTDFYNIANVLSRCFGKDHVHVLFFEELKRDYVEYFKKLYRIIGLTPPIKEMASLKKNVGLPDREIVMLRNLNKYRIFSRGINCRSLLARGENRIYSSFAAKFSRFSANDVARIVWPDNGMTRAIESEISESNRLLSDFVTFNVSKYGYLE